ncbi:MAG TPA: pyridoxamine 5'-phosphate oxidase family protein [Candidatus Aminicenantes bacterium]|nr:pyridoxamine 5'-phosphate oxidase family protein [Candidatus Aminicenantes bacterium]
MNDWPKMKRACLAALVLAVSVAALPLSAAPQTPVEREPVLAAARAIMNAQKYCALITLDEAGRPQARTMSPFPPEEDMSVYMATNTCSRKIEQIRKNPRVTLYYADHAKAAGYVCLTGRAVLVDDMKEIVKRKRAYWDQSFPGLKNIVLIKVVPEQLDVLDYEGIRVNETTWRTPSVSLGPENKKP